MGLEMPRGSPEAAASHPTASELASQPTISIIGAGMGGLTCALALAKQGFNQIHVYEAASNLGFVGAGIQLAPNMARILDRLGVWRAIEADAVVLHDTSIRDGASDAELAHVELDYIKETYGYHHMVGHRHTLADGLYQGCLAEDDKITFHFSTTITKVENFDTKPTFTATPRNGTPRQITTDILLGCDGIKSPTRTALLDAMKIDPAQVKVVDTNQAAYRILLTREQMSTSPELTKLINDDRVTRWIAAKRHVIAYPICKKQIYNISTVQPDTNFAAAPTATYTTKGSKTAMLDVFRDFCPTVRQMLEMVPEGEVCEWKLRVHTPLPTWIHGAVALVGDACHPTLPHLAQGAAQAIEDAAVIAVCLRKVVETTTTTTTTTTARKEALTTNNINRALRVYENVRKARAEYLVATAAASGKTLHLGGSSGSNGDNTQHNNPNKQNSRSGDDIGDERQDGEDEEEKQARLERDRMFADLQTHNGNKQGGKVPDKWADRDVQKVIYGVDCEAGVLRDWESLWANTRAA